MSPPLTHEQHLEVLACVQELHACRSLAGFPEHALRALTKLVPSNLSAFNEVNLPRNRIVAIVDRPIRGDIAGVWERFSGQHPMFRHAAETGDGQALKFSDFLSEAEYHRLDLYRAFYREVQAEDQFSIVVRSDGGVLIAIALNRPRRDFDESDRVKLNLVRPHLLQAYANVEELAGHVEQKHDLQTALRETGHGLIALDDGRRVAHATPGAAECLGRHFPVTEPLGALPAPLLDWLGSRSDVPFTAESHHVRLIVRRPRDVARPLLLLSEVANGRPAGARPLTPREREVLRWMAQGKSNAEIAAILGIAPGTAKQHVERILAKLGVENRTAAAAFAHDHGFVGRR